MTIPYDILLNLISYLDQNTLIEYTTLSRSLSEPALRQLWATPRFTDPDRLALFIQHMSHSINQRPYAQWITALTISFSTFYPIPHVASFQSLLSHHLVNLTTLSLAHTFAVISPFTTSYHLHSCLFEHPLGSWLDLYVSRPFYPLVRISITHITDEHLRRVALVCPNLTHVHLTGLISDTGLTFLVDRCPRLQIIHLALPTGLVQSNTITQTTMERIARACPHLTRFTCRGQIRIDPALTDHTFRTHCTAFTTCDIGIDNA